MSKTRNDKVFLSEDEYLNFTEEEHQTWKILFDRQIRVLQNRAADQVFDGLSKLNFQSDKIPTFREINHILEKETSFAVVPVAGYVSERAFFELLSKRKFPVGCIMRTPDKIDYNLEPDMFHDVFGHIPLLTNPMFADSMEQIGKRGLESIERGLCKAFTRLYWFTVEFGLIKTNKGLRIYGAGIMSSPIESIYVLESDIPIRIKFNPARAIKTSYEGYYDRCQETYFVIESYDEIFNALLNFDWDVMKNIFEFFPSIDQGLALNKEEVIQLVIA